MSRCSINLPLSLKWGWRLHNQVGISARSLQTQQEGGIHFEVFSFFSFLPFPSIAWLRQRKSSVGGNCVKQSWVKQADCFWLWLTFEAGKWRQLNSIRRRNGGSITPSCLVFLSLLWKIRECKNSFHRSQIQDFHLPSIYKELWLWIKLRYDFNVCRDVSQTLSRVCFCPNWGRNAPCKTNSSGTSSSTLKEGKKKKEMD